MAARDTSKADDTSTTDEPTSSTSTGASATSPSLDPQRVVIEQAEPEPAVYYGDGGIQAPKTAPVKADYQPFSW